MREARSYRWLTSLPPWGLFDHNRSVIALVLGLDAAAVATFITSIELAPSLRLDYSRFGLLLLAAVLFEEIGRGVARIILRLRGGQYADMSSVWLVASVVWLPLWQCLLFVAVFRGYLWIRHNRPSGREAHREAYAWASVNLSSLCAHWVLVSVTHATRTLPVSISTPAALIGCITAFALVNTFSIAAVVRLAAGPQPLSQLVGDLDQNLIELATVCLGVLGAHGTAAEPLLIFLAIPLAIALQRASLVTQLTQDATTDPKTGLLNAPTWHRVGSRELARAEREDDPVAVLIFDLDYFNKVNDTWGHLVGDQAIVAMGELLRRELREYDTVARFGGEEFVALLPSTTKIEAINVAERVRRQVTLIRLETMQQPGPRLSVSVGLACFPEHGITMDQLLQAADTALYTAKDSGRNQVVAAPEEQTLWPSGQAAS